LPDKIKLFLVRALAMKKRATQARRNPGLTICGFSAILAMVKMISHRNLCPEGTDDHSPPIYWWEKKTS